MRVLNQQELAFVCGAEGVCTPEDSGNQYSGIADTTTVGDELVNLYEAAVFAVSHIIERVADAL